MHVCTYSYATPLNAFYVLALLYKHKVFSHKYHSERFGMISVSFSWILIVDIWCWKTEMRATQLVGQFISSLTYIKLKYAILQLSACIIIALSRMP